MSIDKLNELDDQPTGMDWAEYEPPKLNDGPPPSGVYTFMRVDQDGVEPERKTKDDGSIIISFRFRAEIHGSGPHNGRVVFGWMDTKVPSWAKSCSWRPAVVRLSRQA